MIRFKTFNPFNRYIPFNSPFHPSSRRGGGKSWVLEQLERTF